MRGSPHSESIGVALTRIPGTGDSARQGLPRCEMSLHPNRGWEVAVFASLSRALDAIFPSPSYALSGRLGTSVIRITPTMATPANT